MEELKYYISLKNRLVPFLKTEEIKDILLDLESSARHDDSISAVYGEPRRLAREIIKGRAIRISFLIELALVVLSIVLTKIYLSRISIRLYSLIGVVEFAFLFAILTKDYLIPAGKRKMDNNGKLFWFLETIVIVLEIIVASFFFFLPTYVGSVKEVSNVGVAAKWLCLCVIATSSAVFLISVLLYGIRTKIGFGGLMVQSAVCADVTREYLSRTRNIEDLEVLAKSEYIGSCGTVFLALSALAIMYYIYMTKKQDKENVNGFGEG